MNRATLDVLVDRSMDCAASSSEVIARSKTLITRSRATIADAMDRDARLRSGHAWCPAISGGAPDTDDGRASTMRSVRDRLSGLRVLVVDNNRDVREMLEILFDFCGATVLMAETGRAAFRVFQEAAPDVVVTDIAMPDWTGDRLVREIRALPPDRGGATPVIAVTATYTEADDRARAMEAGFSAWVTKPTSVRALVALVEDMTGRQRASSHDARS